jgi:hypothetical protein
VTAMRASLIFPIVGEQKGKVKMIVDYPLTRTRKLGEQWAVRRALCRCR